MAGLPRPDHPVLLSGQHLLEAQLLVQRSRALNDHSQLCLDNFSSTHQRCSPAKELLTSTRQKQRITTQIQQPLAWNFAAKSLLALGQTEKALEHVEKTVEIDFNADRCHSVKYSGTKERIITGANFWSV